jgi:hypothetical protein
LRISGKTSARDPPPLCASPPRPACLSHRDRGATLHRSQVTDF